MDRCQDAHPERDQPGSALQPESLQRRIEPWIPVRGVPPTEQDDRRQHDTDAERLDRRSDRDEHEQETRLAARGPIQQVADPHGRNQAHDARESRRWTRSDAE
jgi:hypothetical protein